MASLTTNVTFGRDFFRPLRGWGGGGHVLFPQLALWATIFRPSADGLAGPPFRFVTRHDSSGRGNASLEVLLEEFQQALGEVEPCCLASESVLFSRLEVEIEECARLN